MKSILSALATSLLLSFSGAGMATNAPAAPATFPECLHAADKTACEIKVIYETCKNVTPVVKRKTCEVNKRRTLKTQ